MSQATVDQWPASRITATPPPPYYAPPNNNHFTGEAKSYTWGGAKYYVPSKHSWHCYPDFRSIPKEVNKDAGEFKNPEHWVEFMRNLDTPRGYYNYRVGLVPSNTPALRLDGYTRNLPSMPGRETFLQPWPKCDAWVPPVRRGRGEYYGYYNERMEQERLQRFYMQPFPLRIDPSDVPTFAYNARWTFDQP